MPAEITPTPRHDAPRPSIEEVDGLVGRVMAGEPEAFGPIVRRYQREVWGVVSACLHDRVATENLVQETFVRAYAHLDQYQRGRDFGPWIKTIARNLVKEELRRSSREHTRMAHYHDYLTALHEDAAGLADRGDRLDRALRLCREGLAPMNARALELFYEQGLDLSQVADALGRTVGATRQLLFRIRIAIRTCLEQRLAAE